MRTREFLLGLQVCVLGTVVVLSGRPPGHAQEKKDDMRTLSVLVGTSDDQPVTVTLYRDGKAIATRDINTRQRYQFLNLPRGNYEVHFEAPQHTTVVKKVVLEDFDSELTTPLAKGQGTIVLGAGPSLRELEARIKKLEEKTGKRE
jgi:hypothetical protein